MLSDPRMLAPLYLETERNHIRISLSVAEKFNSLLDPRAFSCNRKRLSISLFSHQIYPIPARWPGQASGSHPRLHGDMLFGLMG